MEPKELLQGVSDGLILHIRVNVKRDDFNIKTAYMFKGIITQKPTFKLLQNITDLQGTQFKETRKITFTLLL